MSLCFRGPHQPRHGCDQARRLLTRRVQGQGQELYDVADVSSQFVFLFSDGLIGEDLDDDTPGGREEMWVSGPYHIRNFTLSGGGGEVTSAGGCSNDLEFNSKLRSARTAGCNSSYSVS
jgi:hypothetical protein